MNQNQQDFSISDLGERTIQSPLSVQYFTPEERRILFNIQLRHYCDIQDSEGRPLSIELAGPREKIFFDPSKTKAAIVTCGGLCPGINDVIRALVMGLHHQYGVKNIIGIRYGFQGFIPKFGHPIVELTPEMVENIPMTGGSILACSRGIHDIEEMINALKRMNVDILFCIGGDGTMKAADSLAEGIRSRKLQISIVGIPKTIDNDLNLIQRTFGYDTAIAEAVKVLQCAHAEAKGAPMGIGLVKIMGRQSGFIAAGAALAENDVNFVLIPEIPFDLHGPKGLMKTLEKRLMTRQHCVILIAEGAGQEIVPVTDGEIEMDASGNIRLLDIGLFLKDEIEAYFTATGLEINLKYIDPSYIIRSVPASAVDSTYCTALGQYAVHAGMAGKTGMIVGLMREEYVHLPLNTVTSRRRIDPQGNLWMRVLETTGQPASLKNS
ncbi:MAG: ATP-dependent 6-phosphofructokinase [Syntrophales bacterium]|jgi:6-phosphofructokinase 1